MSKLLNTTWDALWKWRYSFLPRPACVTVHCDRQKGVGEDDGADDDGGVEEEEEEEEVWETMWGDNQQVTISRKHSSDAASQHSPVSSLAR